MSERSWKHPWNLEKFDNLYNKDERFFSIVIKGLLRWLNKNIILYDKSIRHFILSTGSSYLYIEENGYEYTINETTGEDMIYMSMPRCVIEISDFMFDMTSLSNQFVRGTYERIDSTTNTIKGYNAEIRRIPVEINIRMTYVLSTFNEALVLMQEMIDRLIFQRFFKVSYLGQIIECGIEFPTSVHPELNKVDFSSTETNQKTLQFELKITTNYPSINDRTEISNEKIISDYKVNTTIQ